MVGDMWYTLSELSQAQQSAQEAKLARIVREEQKVRHTLAALESQRKEANALAPKNRADLQQVGGDILWQSWIAQRRRALNIQLAQILARKSEAQRTLAKAHGKTNAVDTVIAARQEDHRKEHQKREAQTILALGVLSSFE